MQGYSNFVQAKYAVGKILKDQNEGLPCPSCHSVNGHFAECDSMKEDKKDKE